MLTTQNIQLSFSNHFFLSRTRCHKKDVGHDTSSTSVDVPATAPNYKQYLSAEKKHYGQTNGCIVGRINGQTDRPTDTTSCRVAYSQLKRKEGAKEKQKRRTRAREKNNNKGRSCKFASGHSMFTICTYQLLPAIKRLFTTCASSITVHVSDC